MKKLLSFSIVFVVINSIAFAEVRNTNNKIACSQSVKVCFSKLGEERSRCLFNSANLPACSGTSLGKIIFKRWSMAPSRPELSDAPAFLGPQMVNQECIVNFDTHLYSILDEDLTETKLKGLENRLDDCRIDTSIDLGQN